MAHLEDLADVDGRQEGWQSNGEEFDGAVHFIYDDTPMADDPERAVGFFLANEAEVAAVRRLVGALEVLFEQHGTRRGNAQVGRHAEWAAVKTAARELLELLRASPG